MPVYSNNNSIKNQKRQLVINRIGIALTVVFSFLLINMIFNILPFINSFLLGAFGLFMYAICIASIVIGIMMIRNVRISAQGSDILFVCLTFGVLLIILHLATTTKFVDLSYGQYIVQCYHYKYSAGGVIFAIITYPINLLLTHLVASFTILAIIEIVLLAFTIVHFVTSPDRAVKINNKNVQQESEVKQKIETKLDYDTANIKETNEDYDDLIVADDAIVTQEKPQMTDEEYEDKQKAKSILGLSNQAKQSNERENPINHLKPTFSGSEETAMFDEKYRNNNYSKPQRILHSEPEITAKPERKLTEKDKENLKYLQDITGGYFGKLEEEKPVQKEVKNNNTDYDVMEDLYDEDLTRDNYKSKYPKPDIKVEAKETLFSKSNSPSYLNNINTDFSNNNNIDYKAGSQNNNGYNNSKPNNNSYNNNNFYNNNSLDNRKNNNSFNNFRQDNNSTQNNVNSDYKNNSEMLFGNQFDKDEDVVINDDNSFASEEVKPAHQYNNQNNMNHRNNDNNYRNNDRNNYDSRNNNNNNNNNNNQFKQVKNDKPEEPQKKPYKKPPAYVKPPIDLLKSIDNSSNSHNDNNTEKARILEETLASFNVPAKVVSITKGPAITRFELQMQQGVSVKKVMTHIEDLSMVLEANGKVRMEIPIPGKNAFGVEVPNESIETVPLRDIIESFAFQGSKSPTTYALGKDITGECKVACINKAPHMLVAGQTGSGKSVCLNAMLISLLYKASPEDVKIILVDPKRVEFTLYNGLPHMLIPKAITEIDKAIDALGWLVDEMERRYTIFSQARVRNLEEYNSRAEITSGVEPKLPYIVYIIDELNDFMMQNKKEVEDKIMKITQKSRAAGIHLVVATQRPSVDVITGTIKGNLNCRIAFAVASFPDSKTILDQAGAENLLGKGDMLYSPGNIPTPIRIQGAFVSNEEVEAVVDYVKEHNEATFDSDIEDQMFNKQSGGFNAGGNDSMTSFDPMLKEAVRMAINTNSISVSKIQRAFGLGFPRAGKIVDQMEAAGFISAPDSKKMRTIFITQQEFEERFGEDL